MRKKQTEIVSTDGGPWHPRLAPLPPNPEGRIIKRQAKLLDQQRKTLGDISLEAIRIATLQLAVKKLEEGLRLLAQAGIERDQPFNPQLQKQKPTPVEHPCAICGRPGVYQSKNMALPVAKRPWYCEGEHAQWARGEDREEQQQRAIMPSGVQTAQPQTVAVQSQLSPTPPPAGLEAAMAALQGQKPVNE